MLGEPVGDARLDVPQGRRIERHQVLGGVDQLAVQRPVVVAADLATGGHRRVRRDAPPRQSGAVQHVLVTAPDDDHRMVRRNGVEVAPQRQALLGELRLVPVGVGDHDSAGCGLAHRRRDGRQHLGQRARAGQVHPRPAAARVEVVVGQPRHDRAPAEVDHARRSRLVRTHLGIRPHRQDPAVGDGDRPRPRLRVIHGDDVAVDENRVGGPRARGCASSTVMTLPLTRIVSAGRGAWDHDARPTAARQHVKHRNKVDMLIGPLLDTLRPSVSSSLHQWGVCPGMITTSPLVMRLDTPPSIPEPRTLVIRSIAGTTRRMWGSPSLHPTSDTGMYHRNACIGHAPAKGPRAFAVGWMQFSPTRDMTAHAPCSPSTSRCWRGRSCSSAHRSPTRNAMRCWRRSSAAARGCACTTCGDRICPMRPTIIWSN